MVSGTLKLSKWRLLPIVAVLVVFPMWLPDLIFLAYMPEPQAATRPFEFSRDRFAFANETVWNYAEGEIKSIGLPDAEQEQQVGERYSRRCFVLSRAALQFFKFARFEPGSPALDKQGMRERLRKLVEIDVWKAPLPGSERIIFPGYDTVDQLSRAEPKILQNMLGAGWPTYLRPGNYGIPLPLSRGHQERTFNWLNESLAADMPVILWLVNFPSLNINHTVLVYRQIRERNQEVHYEVYDPNDTSESKRLV